MKTWTLLAVVIFSLNAHANTRQAEHSDVNDIWKDIHYKTALRQVDKVNVIASDYRLLNAEIHDIEHVLYDISEREYNLMLPLPDGNNAVFKLYYAPVYQAELEQEFPSIRTFKGYQIDNPANRGRFDITPHGFHGMFLYQGERVFIDPLQRDNKKTYISYYKKNANPLTKPHFDKVLQKKYNDSSSDYKLINKSLLAGETLKTYRIAVAAAGEYTTFHGGTKELGQAAIVTAINRVNEVYEVDFSAKLVLVGNNSSVVFTDSATDPYDNTTDDLTANENVIENNIGSANYDIGHVMNTGGGGVAFLGVVCTSSKWGGMTGSSAPTGDPFVIDFVAHEIGHQFGGQHSFNGTAGNCGTRSSNDAYEPGSGSTIMAYAGICDEQNLQNNSDAFFHAHSIDQMKSFISSTGNCAATSLINNEPPVVSAGNDFTIPASTPFKLTGSATDVNSDTLTYVWEQMDLGTASSSVATMVDDGSRPLFRSWLPTSSATRYLPRLSDVVAGTSTLGETFATTNRTLNFRLSARDGKGNIGTDNMKVTVSSNSGPFAVTAPTAGDNWVNATNPIVTWNVNNTDQAPVSCSTVDILLSTDSGLNFNQTVKSNTPNDGSEAINVPGLNSATARIQLVCQNNIFFGVSTGDFTISGIGPGGAAPVITAQSSLSLDEDTSLTMKFSDLTVTDSDSTYPTGFTMTLTTGSNYTVNGMVITPDKDFSGSLTVPVKVNDGNNDSNAFNLDITVNAINDAPVITGTNTLETNEDTNLILTINELVITDPDNTIDQMTLTVLSGDNYTLNSTTIIPNANFNGTLTVPVRVNDGKENSNTFNASVTVNAINDAPVITGDNGISINEDTAVTLNISMLQITDTDNTVDQMTLTVMSGTNYTVSGTKITPVADFNGTLSIGVKVNDGMNDSNTFNILVNVIAINDVPVITAVQDQAISEDQSLTISFSMLTISDVDNTTDQMTIIVMPGGNYTFSGARLTPIAEFSGVLTVPVKVNDGSADSNIFNITVTVSGTNDAPIITSSQSLSTTEDQSLDLSISMISITDPDNTPNQLTMLLVAGENYSFDGLTMTPDTNFNGDLNVSVKVNDGQLDSNIFAIPVNVTAVNDAPIITSSQTLSIAEDTSLVLTTDMLTIVDVDNAVSEHTLSISAGENYSVNGTSITPNSEFSGLITVPVMVNDGELDSNVFELNITVSNVNDTPVIMASVPQVADEDQSLNLSIDMLTVTDIDTQSNQLTLQVLAGNNYTVNALTVTPDENFNGELLVNLTVTDGETSSINHQMIVTVNAINDNPVAAADSFTVEEDSQNNSLSILSNDTDVEGDALVIESINYTGSGTVTISGANLVYSPLAGFDGSESLTYIISDGQGGTAQGQVSMVVTAKSSGGGGSMPVLYLCVLLPYAIIRRLIKSKQI